MLATARRSARLLALLILAALFSVAAFAPPLPASAQDAAELGLSDSEQELVEVDWFEEMLEGGVTMLALGLLSVALVSFAIERLIRLRTRNMVPDGLLAELLPLFHDRQYAKIEKLCEQKPSALADIARFLVAHRKAEPQILLTAAGDLGVRQIVKQDQKCQPFAVIAGIAPLLGLLGTMIGMIESFKLVEVFGDEGGASLLAGSISKALITTAVGLILAIPALIAYHGFKQRSHRIGTQLEEATERLFNAWFLTPRPAAEPTPVARSSARSEAKSHAASDASAAAVPTVMPSE